MPVEAMKLPDGRTVNTSPKFDLGRNFCNKLWNASRFALGNLLDLPEKTVAASELMLEDRWILSRLMGTIQQVTSYLNEYKFSEPVNTLYRFFWNELCDWYLEFIKPRMRQENQKELAQRVLAYVMDATLRLFHPFLPFITEGIYQSLHAICPKRSLKGLANLPASDLLIQAPWPKPSLDLLDPDSEQQMELVQNTIRQIRDLRTQYKIPPSQPLKVSVKAEEDVSEILRRQDRLLCHMAQLSDLTANANCTKPDNAAVAVSDEMQIYVHDVIDLEAERTRLTQQKQDLQNYLEQTQNKLRNENFVTRAKPEVVQRERERLNQLLEQIQTVDKNLKDLT